jgi:hypothetical protein
MREAADWIKRHDDKTGVFRIASERETRVAMVVVRRFVNPVKEGKANQSNPAGSQNPREFHPKAAWLIDVVKYVGAKDRVN